MNAGPDIERLIATWLTEESPGRAPDRILDAAGRVIDRTHQRRFVAAWREPMHVTMRGFVAAAAIGAVFIGGALFVLRGAPSNTVGGGPSVTQAPATPSPAPSPSAAGPLTACGLFTSREAETMAGITGLGALPTASGSGDDTTCLYNDGGGSIILRVTYLNAGGRAAFETVQDTAGVETVTDLGADAVYDPATATLYVAVGDALVGLRGGTSAETPEQRLFKVTGLGRLAAERM